MRDDLQTALDILCQARTLIHRRLPEYYYPLIYDNLNYNINALRDLIALIDDGKPIPPWEQPLLDKRQRPLPEAARPGHENPQP